MAIEKICGIETEYGISVQGAVDFNPILTSSLLINAYAKPAFKRVRWYYEEENPLRDARGFDRAPAETTPEDDSGLVNIILPNGSRYYVDHAHPEYSSPECSNARDCVIWDKAGERILEDSIDAGEALVPDGEKVFIYKNNSDGKGNSYGCHENYLVDRKVPFPILVNHLIPFFVSRQVFTGAGKVGAENGTEAVDYQISQRADFFEVEVGLETTFKRPIINTRDEPHANPELYRRLHVIVGDANMSEISTYLKMGTTSLLLRMIEDEFLPDLSLDGPVQALHEVSWDPTVRTTVRLADGRTATAIHLQWEYLDHAKRWTKEHEDTADNAVVLERWERVLEGLEEDPLALHRELDWVAEHRLVGAYRERDGLAWDDPKLALIDLQYHDVRRDRGLYHRLAESGNVERLVPEAEVERAMRKPPEDTRAFFRGGCIRRYPDAIVAASWDSVIFDVGRDALQRVPMREPLRGTREHVEGLFEQAPDAASLVDLLQG